MCLSLSSVAAACANNSSVVSVIMHKILTDGHYVNQYQVNPD
jgi:hypothetical protein